MTGQALRNPLPGDAGGAPAPAVPTTLDETGIGADVIEQLLIKSLFGGEATGLVAADAMRLSFSVLEPFIEHARAERLIEVRGATGTGAAGYRYALTDAGRSRAQQYLDINRYVGPAPVSLAAYVAQMRAVAEVRGYIDRDRLRRGFSDLVVSESVLEQLGPGINAGKAIFLYGPPGNGKTVIAEGLGRALGGDMYMPHAIEIDGHIITMFDPITHVPLDPLEISAASGSSLASGSNVASGSSVASGSNVASGFSRTTPSVVDDTSHDRRWVRIKRPVVMVGGELTLDMLDLRFNPIAKFYESPVQLKANGGVFLVDDFGRQRMRPEDLLNRWIVPLESRLDYLTLHTGKKFQVPFDVLIVFATNLDPASLADEAFLRRIPYKIAIGDPTLDQFSRIFEMNCRRRRLRYHQVLVAYLQRRHYGPMRRPLRACHPRDLLDQVTALCRYRGIEPVITRELLDAACASYFIDDEPRRPLNVQ